MAAETQTQHRHHATVGKFTEVMVLADVHAGSGPKHVDRDRHFHCEDNLRWVSWIRVFDHTHTHTHHHHTTPHTHTHTYVVAWVTFGVARGTAFLPQGAVQYL